jgi:two-component system, response regulator PdtaR
MSAPCSHIPVVLVVDDEAIIRMNAADMLADEGFATIEACDAEDALAEIIRHPEISVLFTDINMPGQFDGLELARLVHEYRPDIRLILTSGRSPPPANQIPDDGRFLSKPYDQASLARLVAA